MLWATHDLGEAEDICDRIIMLSRGAIVADGSPAELREFHGSYSRISWRDGSGATHVVNEVDPNPVIVEVASTPGVSDIEVRTRSLEDIYLEVIRGTDKGRALD